MNLFYHTPSKTWVDMQIMYENLTAIGLDRKVYKRYCDNIPIDSRRVVTVRTSSTGRTWTNDWGCLDKHQKSEHCKTFNTSAIVGGDADKGGDDPPDLEFYREPQRYPPNPELNFKTACGRRHPAFHPRAVGARRRTRVGLCALPGQRGLLAGLRTAAAVV